MKCSALGTQSVKELELHTVHSGRSARAFQLHATRLPEMATEKWCADVESYRYGMKVSKGHF